MMKSFYVADVNNDGVYKIDYTRKYNNFSEAFQEAKKLSLNKAQEIGLDGVRIYCSNKLSDNNFTVTMSGVMQKNQYVRQLVDVDLFSVVFLKKRRNKFTRSN